MTNTTKQTSRNAPIRYPLTPLIESGAWRHDGESWASCYSFLMRYGVTQRFDPVDIRRAIARALTGKPAPSQLPPGNLSDLIGPESPADIMTAAYDAIDALTSWFDEPGAVRAATLELLQEAGLEPTNPGGLEGWYVRKYKHYPAQRVDYMATARAALRRRLKGKKMTENKPMLTTISVKLFSPEGAEYTITRTGEDTVALNAGLQQMAAALVEKRGFTYTDVKLAALISDQVASAIAALPIGTPKAGGGDESDWSADSGVTTSKVITFGTNNKGSRTAKFTVKGQPKGITLTDWNGSLDRMLSGLTDLEGQPVRWEDGETVAVKVTLHWKRNGQYLNVTKVEQ